ncbi:hypothetical protein GQR58_022005 [Nymphon striatum]|nr:hypothetical protein GQR58_022005 [Nymphon striatum]
MTIIQIIKRTFFSVLLVSGAFISSLSVAQANVPGITTGAQLQAAAEKRTKVISTEELKKELDENLELILVDIRLPTEIKNMGGAIKADQNRNIPRGWLEYRITSAALSKDTPIVVYCGAGIRTPLAADYITKNGLYQRKKLLRWSKVYYWQVNSASSINEDEAIIENDANSLHLKTLKISEQNNITNHNLLNSRLSLFLKHKDEDVDDTFAIKEREYMKGSFSLSRFMVWAIPIMGFIGTVWGISNGISHFSDAMTSTNSVTDVSAMLKENLPLVTSSLATAFDTTLLALLLSIPLMMLMLTLEKSEEAYLIDLDERWFHDIKPLLKTESTEVTNLTSTALNSNTDSSASNNKVARRN